MGIQPSGSFGDIFHINQQQSTSEKTNHMIGITGDPWARRGKKNINSPGDEDANRMIPEFLSGGFHSQDFDSYPSEMVQQNAIKTAGVSAIF